MTTPPESPHPLGADAPTRDYVGLAMGAMGLAVAVGVTGISLVTWTVRTVQTAGGVPVQGELGLAGTVLLGGTLLVLAAVAAIVWITLAPVRSPYRQGGLAMATVFAAFLLAVIGTFVADNWLGRGGLLGLAMLGVVAAWGAARKVGRERATLAAGDPAAT